MAATDPWSPERYARFAAERRLPFDDLVALLAPAPAGRVIDLGCGAGVLTRELHLRTGAAETLGVDSSPAMLEKAAPLAGGGLRFLLGDAGALAEGARGPAAGRWDPAEGRWDVVFSNAALHWVPDHEALLPRLAALVAPGGQIGRAHV